MCLEGITQNVHKTLLRTILKRKREKNGGGRGAETKTWL